MKDDSLSENSDKNPQLLLLDTISKESGHYSLERNSYNLVVTNATIDDDGVFECEAGYDKRTARVYIYDSPEKMTLDWEHGINKPGAVEANAEYKLKCTTVRSYPEASHRYFKDGVELNYDNMMYIYENETDSNYVNVTSILPFTPSNRDVNEMRSIRCVADLYNKKNVSSLAFGINSATRIHQVQLGTALLMLASALFAS
ncbi:kin of IRRE-like protein 1 [Watersipora subatra]|uniref:kin of IRRE-like protein 1 n=1 Tax=Watersipora subatra TaxID=2589382 RepID=UPI00355BBD3F